MNDHARHEEKLGTQLWRTLDRLESSLADRRIAPDHAREILYVVSELIQALGPATGSEDRRGSSLIQPRTHGSNA